MLEVRDGDVADEIKVLIRLGRHPRLVRYVGLCQDAAAQKQYILVEFAPLGSLDSAMEDIEDDLTPSHQRASALPVPLLLPSTRSVSRVQCCARLRSQPPTDLSLRHRFLLGQRNATSLHASASLRRHGGAGGRRHRAPRPGIWHSGMCSSSPLTRTTSSSSRLRSRTLGCRSASTAEPTRPSQGARRPVRHMASKSRYSEKSDGKRQQPHRHTRGHCDAGESPHGAAWSVAWCGVPP